MTHRLARSVAALAAVATLLITLPACDFGEGESLYDPDAGTGEAPVIESVSPDDIVLAGISEITITGRNFSPTVAENLVVFDDGAGNSAFGTVLEAAETLLLVRVPNLPNDALRLRVSVQGAQAFSNAVPLALASAFSPFGELNTGIREDPRALANTDDGGVYVTFYTDGSAVGVREFAPDGSRVTFSTAGALWTGLAPLPDGGLVGVRQNRGAFELPEGGSTSPVLVRSIPSGNALRDVAAVGDGSFWTGGTNSATDARALYRFTADGDVTATVPFSEPVVSLAVAGGTLYVATSASDAGIIVDSKVWRFPLTDGGVGDGSVLYDVTASQGSGIGANALVVAPDGAVFVGTNAPDPLTEVDPAGTASIVYPGVLPSPIIDLAWAPGAALYAIQGLTADELNDSAGRGTRDLLRIEVSRRGPF